MSEIESAEVEQVVIGGVLREPKLISELALDWRQFGDRRHKEIFKAFLEMADQGKPIELTALIDYIGSENMDTVGGIGYLAEIAGGSYTTVNIQYYAQRIVEHFQVRETSRIGLMLSSGQIDFNEGLRLLEKVREQKADKANGSIEEPLKQVVNNAMNAKKGGLKGLTTGFRDLNRILKGFQRNNLILFAARPSVGKSAFLNNIMLASVKTTINRYGGNVLCFSAEMGAVELLERMASTLGNIDSERIQTGTMEKSDWKKFNMAIDILWKAKELDSLRIIDTPVIYLSEIWRQAREMKRERPDEELLIGIDYLQLVRADGTWGSKREEVEEISRSLKALAREVNAPVIALSQLSRGTESRQDKRPVLSDLRDSGTLEQDADVVGFLYREDYYDKQTEQQNLIEIIIAKQRNGPTGTVNLAFIKEMSKFVDIDINYPNN